MIEYLEKEYKCMNKMNSPSIVNLYDYQTENNNTYLLMEYCNGGNLISYQQLQPNKVISLKKAVSILVEIINGL